MLILLWPSLPLPSHRVYVITLAECRPPHWCCHHLWLSSACMWLCWKSVDPLTNAITVFAFPQGVCDHLCKVQTPSLMPSPPLPFLSMYVIVLEKCRPPHWCCHCLCLPTGCMWSCLQSADPLTDAITTFAFPQLVCDRHCKVQTPSLMLSLPLPSPSMYVIVLAKCKPPHWGQHHLCPPTVCMWSCLQSVDPLTDAVTAFAFPQSVCDHACKVQTPP